MKTQELDAHPRVLSIPAQHPFVDATWPPTAEAIRPAQLPTGDRWHPHPGLEADWIRAHAGEFDIVHLHFGFEHRSLAQIRDFIRACADTRVVLVVTVHDLANPHLSDQRAHRDRLRALTAAAAAVFTLTSGAAAELAADYGISAEVIAHPPIVPAAQATQVMSASGRRGRSAAVFLKDLRTNVVADPAFYLSLASGLHRSGAWLEVWAHRSSAAHPTVTALQAAADSGAAPGLDLHLTDRLPDAVLYRVLSGCAVSVLPYAHGTHSGWLEMCRDLGLSVIAPDCGHYAGQADAPEAVRTYRTGSGAAAAEAAVWAIRRGLIARGDVAGRAPTAQQAYAHAYAQAFTPRSAGAAVAAPAMFLTEDGN